MLCIHISVSRFIKLTHLLAASVYVDFQGFRKIYWFSLILWAISRYIYNQLIRCCCMNVKSNCRKIAVDVRYSVHLIFIYNSNEAPLDQKQYSQHHDWFLTKRPPSPCVTKTLSMQPVCMYACSTVCIVQSNCLILRNIA